MYTEIFELAETTELCSLCCSGKVGGNTPQLADQ